MKYDAADIEKAVFCDPTDPEAVAGDLEVPLRRVKAAVKRLVKNGELRPDLEPTSCREWAEYDALEPKLDAFVARVLWREALVEVQSTTL